MSVAKTSASLTLEREQIRGLAPDYATARTADELARGERWGVRGRSDGPGTDGCLLWAEFPESRRLPTHTTISLPDLRAACTCGATRFPCRHIIAVLLRDQVEPAQSAALPDWAAESDRAGESPPLAPVTEENREAAVVAGMADLRVWLGDLVRQGLADLPKRGRGLWLGAANRLVDAYALEAARQLREMASIPGNGPDWPERLLPRLGRLALLGEAFARLDDLSPGERADALLAAAGPGCAAGESMSDEWLVLGQANQIENREFRSRVWLFGLTTKRWARVDHTCAVGRLEGACLPAGAVMAGDLTFATSAFPHMACAGRLSLVRPGNPAAALAALTGMDEGLARYAAALAVNPWLRHYPLAPTEVFVEPPATDGRWRVRDRGGRVLPLPARFPHGWRLLSLAADRPLSLFGEWDGTTFTPLSVYDKVWQAMAGWRGLP